MSSAYGATLAGPVPLLPRTVADEVAGMVTVPPPAGTVTVIGGPPVEPVAPWRSAYPGCPIHLQLGRSPWRSRGSRWCPAWGLRPHLAAPAPGSCCCCSHRQAGCRRRKGRLTLRRCADDRGLGYSRSDQSPGPQRGYARQQKLAHSILLFAPATRRDTQAPPRSCPRCASRDAHHTRAGQPNLAGSMRRALLVSQQLSACPHGISETL